MTQRTYTTTPRTAIHAIYGRMTLFKPYEETVLDGIWDLPGGCDGDMQKRGIRASAPSPDHSHSAAYDSETCPEPQFLT